MGSERPKHVRSQRRSVRAMRPNHRIKLDRTARHTYWGRLMYEQLTRWSLASTWSSSLGRQPYNWSAQQRKLWLTSPLSDKRRTPQLSPLHPTTTWGTDSGVVAARSSRAAVYRMLRTRGRFSVIRTALQRSKKVRLTTPWSTSAVGRRGSSSLVRYSLKPRRRQHARATFITVRLQLAYYAKRVLRRRQKRQRLVKAKAKQRVRPLKRVFRSLKRKLHAPKYRRLRKIKVRRKLRSLERLFLSLKRKLRAPKQHWFLKVKVRRKLRSLKRTLRPLKRRLFRQPPAAITYFSVRRRKAALKLNKQRWRSWRWVSTTKVSANESRKRLLRRLGEKPAPKKSTRVPRGGPNNKKVPAEPIAQLVQRLKEKLELRREQCSETENLRHEIIQLDSVRNTGRWMRKHPAGVTRRLVAVSSRRAIYRHTVRTRRRRRHVIGAIVNQAKSILRKGRRTQQSRGAIHRWSNSALRLLATFPRTTALARVRRRMYGVSRRLYRRHASYSQLVSRAQFLRGLVHQYRTVMPAKYLMLPRRLVSRYRTATLSAFSALPRPATVEHLAVQPRVLRLSRGVRIARLLIRRRRCAYTPQLSWWVRARKLKRQQRRLAAKNKRKKWKRVRIFKAFRRSKHRRWYWRPKAKELRFRAQSPARRTHRRAAENRRNMRFPWWWEVRAKKRARRQRRELRRTKPKRRGRSLKRPTALWALVHAYSHRYWVPYTRLLLFRRARRTKRFNRVVFYNRRPRLLWLSRRQSYQRGRLRIGRKKKRPLKIVRRRQTLRPSASVTTSQALFQARLRSALKASPATRALSPYSVRRYTRRSKRAVAIAPLPWYFGVHQFDEWLWRIEMWRRGLRKGLGTVPANIKRYLRSAPSSKPIKANLARKAQAVIAARAFQTFKPTGVNQVALPTRYPGSPSSSKKKI